MDERGASGRFRRVLFQDRAPTANPPVYRWPARNDLRRGLESVSHLPIQLPPISSVKESRRKIINLTISVKPALMFRPEQDRLLVGSFHFDAMGFHAGIILESIMDDPPIEGVERLELHHITPTPDLFSGLFGFFHPRLPGLGAVASNICRYFWRRRDLF